MRNSGIAGGVRAALGGGLLFLIVTALQFAVVH